MGNKKVPRYGEDGVPMYGEGKKKPWSKENEAGIPRESYHCIDEMEERASIFVPYITERVIEGASYGEIAKELGIDRNTLYKYRKTVAFQEFKERMIDEQLEDIMNVRSQGDLATAMRYREGLIKIAVPKKIEQKIETDGEIVHKFLIVPPSEEQIVKSKAEVEKS